MSALVKATPAPAPRTKDAKRIAVLYAAILVVMSVAQLFSYESFLQFITALGLPGGQAGAYLLGASIVTAEVLALPFLLGMALSRAFRWFSMILGWLIALLWTILSVWIVFTKPAVDTAGFLGTLAPLTPGWWAVFIGLAFGIMAAWAGWGLWPGKRSVNKK